MSLPRLLPHLVCAALVLAALTARAQTSTTGITVTLSSPASGITTFPSISGPDCRNPNQDQLLLQWSLQVVGGQREQVFFSKSDNCAANPSSEDLNTGAVVMLREGDRSNFLLAGSPNEQLPPENNQDENQILNAARLFQLAGVANCGEINKDIFLCVRITTPGSAGAAEAVSSGRAQVKLDSVPPAAPTNVTAQPQENGLLVNWAIPSNVQDAVRFRIFVKDPTGTLVANPTIQGQSARSASVDGLANGTTYTVQVTALDNAGIHQEKGKETANESALSDAATGTPEPVTDFWEAYKGAGGKETGGCQSGGGSLLALLPAALLLLRRRRAPAALLALGLLIAASPARAQNQTESLHGALPRELQSPRRYTLEFHLGEYKPNIDKEPGLGTTINGEKPYAAIFNNESHLLWKVGFAVDLFDQVGRLQLGLETGFWQAVGKALSSTGAPASDTVLLTIVPVTPMLTYRADFIWEWWSVPLVPFAKLGYGWAWWQTEVHDKVSQVGGDKGEGWARGVEYYAGLQFVLDGLEPDKAASLDQDFGINSTSVYVQYGGRQWEGAHGLRLHGNTFSGGILFAF